MTTLSLVVAAPDGARPEPFLAALEAGGALRGPNVEILVVEAFSRPVGHGGRRVRVLTAPGPASIFQLWGQGVRAAKGQYLAMLDLRCPIEPDWMATVVSAIAQNPTLLFGPVTCAWPKLHKDYLGYLTEYAQFHPPMAQDMGEIPGVNLILRRDLARHPAVLCDDGFKKTRILPLLADMPSPMRLQTAAVTYRKSYVRGAYYAHRFAHGRSYGAQRGFTGRLWPRFAAIALTTLLPFVRTWRVHRHASRLPDGKSAFWRSFVRILAAETAWSAGELAGYCTGRGSPSYRLR